MNKIFVTCMIVVALAAAGVYIRMQFDPLYAQGAPPSPEPTNPGSPP